MATVSIRALGWGLVIVTVQVIGVEGAIAQTRSGAAFSSIFSEVGRVVVEDPDVAPITGLDALDRFSDGRFVFVDSRGVQVRIHSSDGEFVQLLGREGEGPGEYIGPLDVAVAPDDALYLADTRGPIIQRFDPSLVYDTAFSLADALFPFQVEVIDERVIVGGRRAVGAPYSIFSHDGRLEHTFHDWPAEVVETPYWRSVARDHSAVCSERIFIATNLVYPLQVYDMSGAHLATLGIPPKSWRKAPALRAGELAGLDRMKKLAEWLKKFTVIDALACYEDEYVFVTHGKYASGFTQSVGDLFRVHQYALDVYRFEGDDGRMIKLFEDVEVPGRVLHVDDYVYVLLSEPPAGWMIGVYKLTLD